MSAEADHLRAKADLADAVGVWVKAKEAYRKDGDKAKRDKARDSYTATLAAFKAARDKADAEGRST